MHDTVELGITGLSPAVYVGAGGSANVFAARLLETGQEVAVKLLRASADTAKERERFAREHETIDRLSSHEGIVPVVAAGVTDRNEPYFLMPLMQGSLQDRIDNEGALDWQTASQLVAEISDTLEFAHSQSVLHRDLKPGNILLDANGVPRVADFGIAKLLDSNVSKSSKALGTPSFMPPERFKAVEATEASDVYGLGATLAALLTGTAPFLTGENDTDAAVMMRVMSEDLPPLTGSGIPESVAAVVTQSMAKDPMDRPASAGEFAHLLRTASVEAGGPATSGPVTVAIPRRELLIPELSTIAPVEEKEKRPLWIWAAAAAAFVMLVGVGGALAFSQPENAVAVLVAGETETTTIPGADGAVVDDAANSEEPETDIGQPATLVADADAANNNDGPGATATSAVSPDTGDQDTGDQDTGDQDARDQDAEDDTDAEDKRSDDGDRAPTTNPDTATTTTVARVTTTAPATTSARVTTTAPATASTTTTTRARTSTTTTAAPDPVVTTTAKPVVTPVFSQRIDIGDIGESNVRFRFMSNITTGYTISIRKDGSAVTSQSGTAQANSLVNANVGGLTEGTEYTILVTLNGPPAVNSGSVLFKTAGTTVVDPPEVTPVVLQNLRLVSTGSTRFEFHYDSNICANGSFVIREQGGATVGSNAGQADGCTNRHLGIPGFWTNALTPNTTYVVTVTVEANGRGQGGGNTATRTLTVTTSG